MHDSDPARKLTKSQSTVGGTTPRATLYAASFGIAARLRFVITLRRWLSGSIMVMCGQWRPKYDVLVKKFALTGQQRVGKSGG